MYENLVVWRYVVEKLDGTPMLLLVKEEDTKKYTEREDLIVYPVYKMKPH